MKLLTKQFWLQSDKQKRLLGNATPKITVA